MPALENALKKVIIIKPQKKLHSFLPTTYLKGIFGSASSNMKSAYISGFFETHGDIFQGKKLLGHNTVALFEKF
jgi:hypothetical protein